MKVYLKGDERITVESFPTTFGRPIVRHGQPTLEILDLDKVKAFKAHIQSYFVVSTRQQNGEMRHSVISGKPHPQATAAPLIDLLELEDDPTAVPVETPAPEPAPVETNEPVPPAPPAP